MCIRLTSLSLLEIGRGWSTGSYLPQNLRSHLSGDLLPKQVDCFFRHGGETVAVVEKRI